MNRIATLALALFAVACAPQLGPTPTAALEPPLEGEVTAVGTFEGASDHITTGEVRLIRLDDGSYAVEFGEDFSHDGAPDPVVGFGADGYVETSKLGPLVALEGQQVYPVPDDIDVGDFNQVYVWCEQFGVPLGVAALDLTV